MYKRTIDDSWSFRSADTKEYTHCYHAYPAMMIPQVARTLIDEYRPEGRCSLLLDPYMGSGTSLVEANLVGINAIGSDINPLARLISKAKTTHFDEAEVNKNLSALLTKMILFREEDVRNTDFARISNSDFWYSHDALLRLSFLTQIIDECTEDCQDFFRIALSEIVREVSYTRNGEFKRYRMTEEKIKQFCPDIFALFEQKVCRNINGLKQFNRKASKATSKICHFNSVDGISSCEVADESVDMVVTSPPYGDSRTTVAYGQFSRWSNEWFDHSEAQQLDNMLMGGARKARHDVEIESIAEELNAIKLSDTKRYEEVLSFLSDYSDSIKNVSAKVRRGGMVCYVVGNRTVKGIQIPLDYFTAEHFCKYGFEHINTIVRSIPNKRMPSKNSPTNETGVTNATMTNEYIVVLRKQ